MRKEMESLQLRANNWLILLKDMFKGQTVHKGKAQQNRRMKENSRRTKKNEEARFKVAAERLLEEIASIKILDTCFPNGMSVKAQSLYQVKLAVISKRSLASVQRKQQKNATISMVERGTLGSCGGNFSVASVQSRKQRRRPVDQSLRVMIMFLKPQDRFHQMMKRIQFLILSGYLPIILMENRLNYEL